VSSKNDSRPHYEFVNGVVHSLPRRDLVLAYASRF